MIISAGKHRRGILYSKVFVIKTEELLITAVTLSFWPKLTQLCRLFLHSHTPGPLCCVAQPEGAQCASDRHLCLGTELLHLLSPRGKYQACWQWWWCPLLFRAPGPSCLSYCRHTCWASSGISATRISQLWDTGTRAPAQPEPCSQVVPSVELACSTDLCLSLNTDFFVLVLSSYDTSPDCVSYLLLPQRKRFSCAWCMCRH